MLLQKRDLLFYFHWRYSTTRNFLVYIDVNL